MRLIENELYMQDVSSVANMDFAWEQLYGKTILISGASGMIGSFLIDVLMYRNQHYAMDCKILAIGRNIEAAKNRFGKYWYSAHFCFIAHDINEALHLKNQTVEYVFHAASNTHPVAYAQDPIGTITTNVIGTQQLLQFACEHGTKRVIFLSTVEVYGENQGDTHRFDESYCGYIDCNTLRAGYPESKRCGEALCQAYIKQKDMDIVIPRLSRIYGATMLMSDTKALSQFIKKGVAEENIVLKSAGTQLFSYTYVADAVSGILTVFFKGKCGAAYNIADQGSEIMLKDLAGIIADYVGKEVVFELPDEVESAGYSKARKAIMDDTRIHELGWKAMFSMKEGLERTITILKYMTDKKR